MCYYNGRIDKGEWTEVYCEKCGDRGYVPLVDDDPILPWVKYPTAPPVACECDGCGKLLTK